MKTMTTTSPASIPELDQYRIVHEGIQAVAAHCDGAVSLDYQGFDGQDTHYGRRIAGIPFEKLTADDHVEIARIANKYREQILRWTGVAVADFPVVLAAKGIGTNHQSRQNARRWEKLSAVQAERKVILLPNGKVGVKWANGDPDFDALVTGARALPGRDYNRATRTNEVDATDAVLDFANAWDMEIPADVLAAVEAKKAAPKPMNIGLLKGSNGKRLWIKAPYDAARVVDARQLPGRRWTGEMDEVDAHPAVIAFAEKWGLEISPKAMAAINEAAEEAADQADAAKAKLDRAGLMSLASRAGSINDLPEEMIEMIKRAVG
jgi:hypothetical protein